MAVLKRTTPTRRAIRIGVIAGAVGVYLAVTGVLERFHTRTVITGEGREPLLTLGYAAFLVLVVAAGYLAVRPRGEEQTRTARGRALWLGGLAGGLAGAVVAVLLVVMKGLIAGDLRPREIFVSVSPALLDDILAFGQGTAAGVVILVVAGGLVGLAGAGLRLLARRTLRPLLLGVGVALFVGLMEPLLRVIMGGLDIPTSWLYRAGGVTVPGVVVVMLGTTGGSILWTRWNERLARRAPAGGPGGTAAGSGMALPPVAGRREPSPGQARMDRVVLALGLAAFAYTAVLASMFFLKVEVPSMLLLVALGLGVVGTVLGAATSRAMTVAGTRRGPVVAGLFGSAASLFIVLPLIVGPFLSDVLGFVLLYVLLGLGLNIVVGYAGLLDLGYVAFFAVGAYATAVLTSRASFLVVETGRGVTSLRYADSGWTNFWVAIPIVVILAVVAGVLIGAPVLRLRGDYLAIVTLGFGEIVRVLVFSNWLDPWLGGAQGLIQIPAPPPASLNLRSPERIYYIILTFTLVAAFISYRLKDSRVGRAWAAMREDESVAEAMGVSVVKYKLLAFAMGAGIGCLGGAFFAAKIGSVFPGSFNILVSINALSVLILGGMGSIPGVIVGSLVLVGVPELLRGPIPPEYRLLIYGAILVAVMILKPEGLLPEVRRRRELHEEQLPEEARFAAEAAAPVVVMEGEGEET